MFHRLSQISSVEDGDLIFFLQYEKGTELATAVRNVLENCDVFHVGILSKDAQYIIHSLPKYGVCMTLLDEAINELDPDCVQIYSLSALTEIKAKAFEWAKSRIGANYNDIFSPNCFDSTGQEAYYCCQFVIKAYTVNNFDLSIPPHKLNFSDTNGIILTFWEDYFAKMDRMVPQDEPGSHPGKLIKSKLLQNRICRYFRPMSKFVVPKVIDASLHFVKGASTALITKDAKYFDVIQPRNGQLLTKCTIAGRDAVDLAVEDARFAQHKWNAIGVQERGKVLLNASRIVRESLNELSYLESLDCGKPICESRMDVESCADCFEFFAGAAQNLAGHHFPLSESRYAYTQREPWGVVGAIGVWNYPLQTAVWKVAPALACGNAVVYKPSPLAPITSYVLSQILQHAGLPDGVFSVLQGEGETGRLICEHPDVHKVTFTGSSLTGSSILKSCSLPGRLKPATLELGGKSACIIFSDAPLDSAVAGAFMANFYCQGAVCSNASKILVQRSIYDEFRKRVVAATKNIVIGDPLLEKTKHGAIISKDHLIKVKSYISEAVDEGAKVLCGGEEISIPDLEGGFYLSPAVLDGLTNRMRIYYEEVFGAVMLLIPFETEEEAVEIANDTIYGLAAGLFTTDLEKAYKVTSRLQAGSVFVNTFNDANAMLPFGGMKQSGFGRENGIAALEAFSQVKSVFVNASKHLENPFL